VLAVEDVELVDVVFDVVLDADVVPVQQCSLFG
jgi:hypothetical protein